MSAKHDSAYKDFFSHEQVVADFLRDYVQQPWVQSVDLRSLERVNSSYVHEADQQRIGDVVWRLKLRDGSGWVYMYLLIEFQSRIDRHMALRMMVYVGLFYQDLIKQGQLGPDGLLPPIFPAVIYNGSAPWSAPRSLSALITPVAEPLQRYLPNMGYFVLDEGRVHPLAKHNALSTIIQLEQAPDTQQLAAALAQARELLGDTKHSSLRQAILAWLEGVVLRRVAPKEHFPKFRQLQEVQTMLAETVTRWTQQWLEQGRQEGEQRGLRKGEQIGEQRGKQKGLREGEQRGLQKTVKAVVAMAKRGFAITEIAQDLDLSESEVRRILKSAG